MNTEETKRRKEVVVNVYGTKPTTELTFNQILEYESGSTSFFMSYWYSWFPKLLVRRCRRKYKRYQYFIKNIHN